MRLTLAAKIFITVVILGVVAFVLSRNPSIVERIAPSAHKQPSSVPPQAKLPDLPPESASALPEKAGCPQLPEVRFYHWAWNAQMGLMLAVGGKQAIENSL